MDLTKNTTEKSRRKTNYLDKEMEGLTMEEEKKNIETEAKQEHVDKLKDKKNAFTMTYILVGITILAILGLIIFALITSK